jgi:hypothetical protein
MGVGDLLFGLERDFGLQVVVRNLGVQFEKLTRDYSEGPAGAPLKVEGPEPVSDDLR